MPRSADGDTEIEKYFDMSVVLMPVEQAKRDREHDHEHGDSGALISLYSTSCPC